jgi:hypothetical protein
MKKKLPIYSAYGLFCIALVLLLIAGCENQSKRAARYNDAVVKIQSTVVVKLHELDSALNEGDLPVASFRLNDLVEEIDVGTEALTQLGAFEGDSVFQLAAMGLLDGYKRIAQNHYDRLISILALPDSLYTPDVQKEAFQIESEIHEDIHAINTQFNQSQRAFGKANRLVFQSR